MRVPYLVFLCQKKRATGVRMRRPRSCRSCRIILEVINATEGDGQRKERQQRRLFFWRALRKPSPCPLPPPSRASEQRRCIYCCLPLPSSAAPVSSGGLDIMKHSDFRRDDATLCCGADDLNCTARPHAHGSRVCKRQRSNRFR